MNKEYENMHLVILDHETSRVVVTEVPVPKNCADVEAYLWENDILNPSQCSWMGSTNPIPIINQKCTLELK